MTFKKFEDIEAWKLARELCRLVQRLTSKEAFSKDWTLRNQIRSSSGSVMDCIAEGNGRGHNNEFRFFLGVAKGSCEETRSQGYRALDYNFIDQQELDELCALANRTSAAIQGLIAHLNKSDMKGIRSLSPPNKLMQPDDPHFPSKPPGE